MQQTPTDDTAVQNPSDIYLYRAVPYVITINGTVLP